MKPDSVRVMLIYNDRVQAHCCTICDTPLPEGFKRRKCNPCAVKVYRKVNNWRLRTGKVKRPHAQG